MSVSLTFDKAFGLFVYKLEDDSGGDLCCRGDAIGEEVAFNALDDVVVDFVGNVAVVLT